MNIERTALVWRGCAGSYADELPLFIVFFSEFWGSEDESVKEMDVTCRDTEVEDRQQNPVLQFHHFEASRGLKASRFLFLAEKSKREHPEWHKRRRFCLQSSSCHSMWTWNVSECLFCLLYTQINRLLNKTFSSTIYWNYKVLQVITKKNVFQFFSKSKSSWNSKR